MTLNELFRRTGEPTYHTPIAVIGELVNQQGGQVTIINPPYHSQPRAWRKGWAKKLRIGRLYWGLPQQTRLNISYDGYTPRMRKKSIHRHLFRKHGYLVERGDDTVYYDNETDRRPKMEANAHKWGLTVEEWKD